MVLLFLLRGVKMNIKHIATAATITFAGCGWWDNDKAIIDSTEPSITTVGISTDSETQNTVIAPLPQPEPIAIAPLPEPPPVVIPPLAVITPITPDPNATVPPPETGSANLELLAQYGPPRGYREYVYKPVVVSFLGENTTKSVELLLPAPPEEMNSCNSSIMLGTGFPIVEPEYRHNDYWLIATTTSLVGFSPDTPVYFYWAKKISENEVGAVPTGVGTDVINQNKPQNIRINTGFAEVPYQWISRFEMFNHFPQMIEEPCESSKPRK
jgi:hypothetical protein